MEAAPMRKAAQWLETYRDFWESRLDSLARYLESETEAGSRHDENGGRKK
jgi:hypothetical protein